MTKEKEYGDKETICLACRMQAVQLVTQQIRNVAVVIGGALSHNESFSTSGEKPIKTNPSTGVPPARVGMYLNKHFRNSIH